MFDVLNKLFRKRETIRALAVSPDKSMCVVGAWGGAQLMRLNQLDRSIQQVNDHPYGVRAVNWSCDGHLVVTAGYKTFRDRWVVDNTVQLWDVSLREHARTLEHGFAELFSLAISPDSRLIAVSGEVLPTWGDNRCFFVGIWEIATNRTIAMYGPYRSPALSVTFSQDCKLLASGSPSLSTMMAVRGSLAMSRNEGSSADDFSTIRI